jgi:hypothetical protein
MIYIKQMLIITGSVNYWVDIVVFKMHACYTKVQI